MRPSPLLAALAALALAVPFTAEAAVSRVFRQGVSSYTGTRDVTVDYQLYRYWDPDESYNITCTGCTTELYFDGDPVDIASLLRFDLSSIPSGATVTAVNLTFRVNDNSGAYPIYELKKDFVDGEATWNRARSGVPWEQPGASGSTDRGTAVLGTYAPVTGTTPFTYSLGFTAAGLAAVQGWVSTPSANHGMIVVSLTEGDGASVGSANDVTAANRPALTVTYTSGSVSSTVTFQNGVSPSAAYAGTRDTIIGSGSNVNLAANDLRADGFESDSSVLVRFDVSGAIPPWSTVLSVTLDGYITDASGQGFPIYELLRDWTETGATWLNADATTPWTLRGALGAGAQPPADHGTTVLGLLRGPTLNVFNSSALNRNGAKLVQDWIRGNRTNYGFIIQDYADATDDGLGWDDAGSQRCDTAVPPNCTNTSPGMTVVYNEGRFAFTSPPQRIRVGAPSGPFTFQRQRADDGLPIAVGSAPALGVTVRSSSLGGAFALSPAGPWSATLSVNVPAGSADSEPFYYRDASAGSPVLTASLTAAWVNGTQAVSVSSLLLSDDVESGQVPVASGGQWSQVSLQPSCSLSASTAAAHRDSFGLRVADADGQGGAGAQAAAQYLTAPVVPDLYFRTWFRYSGPNQLGNAELLEVGSGPLASLSLNLPARTVTGSGVNDAGVSGSETGTLGVSEGTWHLLELFANGIGTTAGVRRTYVNGQLNTTAVGLDWSGLGADVLSAGEPYSTDRRLTATLDFDDLRASTSSPASRLQVLAPTTMPLEACTPVTVSLRDSVLNALADAPYDFSAALQLKALPGALFADSTCSTPIASVAFPQGARTVNVYASVFAVGGGVITASFPDFLEGSDSFSVVTGQPLAIAPVAATVNPRNVVGLTAAGGSGGGYRWSFLVNRSGATLTPGGVYTAGGTPVVTDVVQVTDSLGASATAPINVVRDLALSPPRAVTYPSGQVSFSTSGGGGTARFSVSDNRSGAVIDPLSGVYNAGGTAGVVDTVSVVDARGSVARSAVQVLSPADFKLNVSGGSFVAGGSATFNFQVVDVSGVAVALPNSLQVRLLPIPGAAPLAATMTSTFTGSDAGNPPATSLTLQTNGNGFASAVVTSRVVERVVVCGALASDARTEACVLASVNVGPAHHARADAVTAAASSCTPARIDVSVVDAFENNIGFISTVQVCPSAGSAAFVSSTLIGARPSGTCLIGDTSVEGTASVFVVDGMDESVTFTPSQAVLTNPPVTAQVTWSGRAPSPSQTVLELVGAADPAPLSTAPGSAVSVHLSTRDACGQPIPFTVASEVSLQLPPPLQTSLPTVDATGFLFSVTAPSCPPLPSEPLPIHARLSGAPVTTPAGALAAVNVLVSCRVPRFLSQGATTAQCNQPYRYSPARVPEVEGDGPFAFSATGLPPGATLSPSGELVWIPTPDQVGSYTVQLTVAGAAGSDTQPLSIDVACGSTVPPAPCGCGAASAGSLAVAALLLALLGAGPRRRARDASRRSTAPGIR